MTRPTLSATSIRSMSCGANDGKMSRIAHTVSCLDGYDPDSLRVDKAREAIRACLNVIEEVENLKIRDALGRVLAQEIVPQINVPAHDNSAMDGYAVRFSDLEKPLKEIGTALAGKPFAGKLGPGECVRIMTGAVMPQGADTVVIQEVVKKEGERITVPPGQKKAQNVRYAGEDLKIGVPVLKIGKFLTPADQGLIASLGIGEVQVKRRLRVAFFATGDELASIGAPLKEGEVYDSNRYTLHGMLSRVGVELIDMGVVRDVPEALEKAFREAAEKADVVITTGGVSVGEADFVKQLMSKLGEVLFWKIAMRPGRPMAFGKIGDAFLFGLPGNPVAVMVTFYQFVRDALLYMSGREATGVPLLNAESAENLRKVPGRTEYQRGILFQEGSAWKVRTTGQQGSGVLRSMSEANCFIVLEHERGSVKAGEPVSVQPFEGLA
jgi:molybdopterin molybdotransferase